MKTHYEPVGGKILIKPDPIEEKTESGLLVLPQQGQERPLTASVISVGPGALQPDGKRAVMQIQPGDRVMYQKYAGTNIEIEGELHIILSEHEIPLLIREDKPPKRRSGEAAKR